MTTTKPMILFTLIDPRLKIDVHRIRHIYNNKEQSHPNHMHKLVENGILNQGQDMHVTQSLKQA